MYYGPGSRGDIWGCVGAWWSGEWHDRGGAAYVHRIQRSLHEKPYLHWESEAGGEPPSAGRIAAPPMPR